MIQEEGGGHQAPGGAWAGASECCLKRPGLPGGAVSQYMTLDGWPMEDAWDTQDVAGVEGSTRCWGAKFGGHPSCPFSVFPHAWTQPDIPSGVIWA